MPPLHQRRKPIKSLNQGRANRITVNHSSSTNLSASKSRKVVRKHHSLLKKYAQAGKAGDHSLATRIQSEIQAHGGLERYQDASKAGQSRQRGGDSSRILMKWLDSSLSVDQRNQKSKFRMLEVGALSVENECSRSGYFDMTRIDLNSQGEGILKQDFMKRPLPQNDDERFDCVSLSLVVNFVPEPKGRGEMLRRVSSFLRFLPVRDSKAKSSAELDVFPCLFLVLPAPCVTNSRYLDENRLAAILTSLGFRLRDRKISAKLVYYLWAFEDRPAQPGRFHKIEVNASKSRNNFAIVLE